MDESFVELFVPGRVCLLGEHSDWAGGFRRFNGHLTKGYTLVTGTNQGLYARVRAHPSKIKMTCTDNAGNKMSTEMPLSRDYLLDVAREGSHWSYVAGVAYKMLVENVVGGIEIDNYMSTLPLKKGLSSSAAVCVLVTRAFNIVYDLKLSTRGEMEYAYQGEILTPSQCGRLDQACAFGNTPILMTYDGEFTTAEKISICTELHFVVVDLRATKDTTKILSGLQSAYPNPQNDIHIGLHQCLGPLNEEIVLKAHNLLTTSCMKEDRRKLISKLGELMIQAQRHFDLYATPLCPMQLEAPVLHRCLQFPALQPFIAGGKGVGAGGDGTAQFLCYDAHCQEQVARIVKEDLQMDPLLLTISPISSVKIAVIPAGGFAASLFPASKACKPELFPVFTDGSLKPLIVNTIEQLVEAGIETIVIVVQQEDISQFRRLFESPVDPHNEVLLYKDRKTHYVGKLRDLGRHVHLCVQTPQCGFGHALWCAREHVRDEAFLLVLGHHVYVPPAGELSCASQLLQLHSKIGGGSLLGLKRSDTLEVSKFGTVTGTWSADNLLDISNIVEKPCAELAAKDFQVPNEESFLTMFGMYVLDSKLFGILDDLIKHDIRESNGLIGLTSALQILQKQQGIRGTVMSGERLAIGTPEDFVTTNNKLMSRYLNG